MAKKLLLACIASLGSLVLANSAQAAASIDAQLEMRAQHFQIDGSVTANAGNRADSADRDASAAGELNLSSIRDGLLSVYWGPDGGINRVTYSGLAGDELGMADLPFDVEFEVIRELSDGALLRLGADSWLGDPNAATFERATGGGEYQLRFAGDNSVSLSTAPFNAGAVGGWGWFENGTWRSTGEGTYFVTEANGYDRSTSTLWYDLASNSSDQTGTLPGPGPDGEGNTILYQAQDTNTGATVHLEARTFAQLGFSGDLTIARVEQFNGGLGACNLNEGSCNQPGHSVDSSGSQDYAVLQFGSQIEFLNFTIGYVDNDYEGAARWWIGTAPAGTDFEGVDPDNFGAVLDDLTSGDDYGDDPRTVNVNGTGNVLIIAALKDGDHHSYIKIDGVHGRAPTSTPDICFEYDLDKNSDSFVSETPGNPFGNILTFVETDNVTGEQVFLELRGYAALSPDVNVYSNAVVQRFNSGSGVCNANEWPDCQTDDHAVDNSGSKDVIVAVFDQTVEFTDFEIGFTGDDGDVLWWIGSAGSDYSLEGVGFNNIPSTLNNLTSGQNNGSDPRFVSVSGTGNVLVIATVFDQSNDSIKLDEIRGCAVPGDPDPGAIGDRVWKDLNGNGVQDAGELGVAGFTVNLWSDDDGDGNPDTLIDTTTTDVSGNYLFAGLDTSLTYIVEFVNDPSMNMPFTTPNGGPDGQDSDADPNNGLSPPINLEPGETNPTIDAGLVNLPASLGDRVWKDLDGNGLQDAGEPGVSGITVNLWTDDDGNGTPDTQIDSTTTGANGLYDFTDLDSTLTYVVQFVNDPAMNMPFTIANAGDDGLDSDANPNTGITGPINLAPGENNPTIDAGLINPAPEPAGLGDRVWKDLDGNGLQDAGEPGVAGITVNLWTDDDGDGTPDTQIATTTTDGDGMYSFLDLDPELTYVVQFINDPGMNMPFTIANAGPDGLDSDADPNTGITGPINLEPGSFDPTIDAGLINPAPDPAGLGDRVWKDLDGNGLQDAGEPGVAGITVNLWTDDDGDGTPDTQIATTTTDGDGMYSFLDLDPELTYVVQFINDPGMNMPFTIANAGPDGLDSDADPNTGITGPINLEPGSFDSTIDAGLINPAPEPAGLGDRVWKDLNMDGQQDDNEPGVSGISVNLWTDDNGDGTADTLIATTVTGADGLYAFNDLDPELTYVVQFVNDPAMNMPFTTANVGDDASDSDAARGSGFTGPINLEPGEFDPTIDAGLVNRPAGLGNRVWKDLNGNGLQDNGEPGVSGIVVNLWTDDDGDGTPDTQIDSTVTNNAGIYFFSGLDPTLTYVVQFINDPAMNMPFTVPNAGDETLDSDADPNTGLTGPITLEPGGFNPDIDAGLVNPPPPERASLGDKVWKDLNGNGLQDANEPGVSGIVVNLWTDDDGDGTPDTQIATTTTNGAGMYAFVGLDPTLTYVVEFINDPSMNMPFTIPNAGDDAADSDADPDSGLTGPINLAPGENNTTIDAGLVNLPGAIGDKVWKDLNNDGLQGPNEPGVPGIVVNLWTDDDGDGTPDTQIATTTTDGDGMYLFDGLDPTLTYIVEFINDPAMGMPFTTPDAGPDGSDSDADPNTGLSPPINLQPGETNLTIDAGLSNPPPALASLGDKVWKDLDGDGLQGAGEPGVSGITVNLWTDDDGDGTPDTQIATTTTDGDGMYAFTDLDPDLTYVVQFINDPAMNMPFTIPNAGDDALDSDANPNTGNTGPINLAPGENNTTIDAGLINPPPPDLASLGDKVWKDLNGDGFQGPNEPGVSGIVVNLWTDDDGDGSPDTQIDSTTTDSDGMYLFTDLDPSLTYIVEFINDPAMNMPFTIPDAGPDGSDSDADPNTGLTPPINLSPGENNTTVDAGLINIPDLASLGDKVWKDLNENGQQDANEPGVSGFEVNLWTDDDGDGTPDTQIRTTQTDSDGMYLFEDLDPSLIYIVQFVNDPSMNMPFTIANAGNDDGDSDADPSSGLTGPISLAPGENNLTIDAGVINAPGNEDASLGDFVWIDENLNGIQDPDEPVVASFRVRLWIDTDGDGEPDTNIRTTNTDGDGFYRFDFLDPGVQYWVQFDTTGTELLLTIQDAGPDDVDSDADQITGFTGPIVLGSGEFNPTIDAGLFKPDP